MKMENAENASEDARPDVACSARLGRDAAMARMERRAVHRITVRATAMLYWTAGAAIARFLSFDAALIGFAVMAGVAAYKTWRDVSALAA